MQRGVETVGALVAPVVQRGVETVGALVAPVVQGGVETVGALVAPVGQRGVQTVTGIVAGPVRAITVVVTAPRIDAPSRGGAVSGAAPAGSSRSTGVSPSQPEAPAAGTPTVVAPEPQFTPPTIHPPQRSARVVTPASAGRQAGAGGTRPAAAALLTPAGGIARSSAAPARAAADASWAVSTVPARAGREPSPAPAGVAGPSGAAGVPGPASAGGGALFALWLAAMSLAAALWFARLLYPPARWRPVFFVSLIERPG